MGDTHISPPSMNGLDSEVASISAKIMVLSMIVLFFMVAFSFFLCLYAKWYWSRGNYPSIASWRGLATRQVALDPTAAQRRGLDRDALQSLPVMVYDPKVFKEGFECSVCLSDVSEGEKCRVLPKCNHGFHLECIDMWFVSHSTCPLCRNSVNSSRIEFIDSDRELPEVSSTNAVANSPSDSESDTDSTANSGEAIAFPTNAVAETSSSSRQRNELVIEIPRNMCEDCLSSPPSTTRYSEEEGKTPVLSRLRSLKRMLSRGKRAATSNSADVEPV